jgi:hypothetical protein
MFQVPGQMGMEMGCEKHRTMEVETQLRELEKNVNEAIRHRERERERERETDRQTQAVRKTEEKTW